LHGGSHRIGLPRTPLMFPPALELAFVAERGRRSKSRSLWVIAVVGGLWIMLLVLHARTLWTLPHDARCGGLPVTRIADEELSAMLSGDGSPPSAVSASESVSYC